MKLSALLQDLIPAGMSLPETNITGLSLSSQQILPNYAFIAMGTAAQYIPDAISRGASIVITEKNHAPISSDSHLPIPVLAVESLLEHIPTLTDRFYGPFPRLSTTGVTGTNGKTTVSYLLAQCLTALGAPCGLIGTLGSGFVDALNFNGMTTPDALGLHRCFAELQSCDAQAVAMEVSSHGLAQERVKPVWFESALFTNLTQDHLDYHGDMESYGNAKLRLFSYPSLQRAILNADDHFTQRILHTVSAELSVMLCSKQSRSQLPAFYSAHHAQISTVTVEQADLTPQGIHAKIETPLGHGQLRSSLLGEFNLSNLLLVVAELLMRNYSLQDVLTVVAMAKSAPGRMQCLKGKNTAQIIIDYAHTPDALTRALQAARLHCKGKLWCVFGCGGDRDPTKRALMGASASQNADHIVITNDNPRTEDPQKIIDAIVSGISQNDTEIFIEPDRAAAIEMAISQAHQDDIILVAGKGHEDYQIIGNTKYPFSDVACVKTLIGESIS